MSCVLWLYLSTLLRVFGPCSWNATYDNLLGSNKPFAEPIPLPVSPPFFSGIYKLKLLGTCYDDHFCCFKLAGNDRFSGGYLGAGWMGCVSVRTETGVTLG